LGIVLPSDQLQSRIQDPSATLHLLLLHHCHLSPEKRQMKWQINSSRMPQRKATSASAIEYLFFSLFSCAVATPNLRKVTLSKHFPI